MKNYIEEGKRIQVTLAAVAAPGDVIIVGSKGVVAIVGGNSGDVIAAMAKGVFELAKGTGALTQGTKIYWDATAKQATSTSTSNTYLGYVFVAAASADMTVQVYIADDIA